MGRRVTLRARLALALVAWAGASAAHAADALVVLGAETSAYREVAACLGEELGRATPKPYSVQLTTPRELGKGLAEARVVVAVGTSALQAVAAQPQTPPVIGTLLPGNAFERVARDNNARGESSRYSAVLLDQPLARYLDLIRVALPDRNRVALLLGPDSESDLAAINQAASARRLKLVAATARSDKGVHTALQDLLAQSDVLLILPDTLIASSRALPYILLSAYHARVPVVGFSPAFVNAGAVLAIYSTPRQLGCQSAELARRTLSGETLPAPQQPREFEIGINSHVARSLDIALDSAEVLRERLVRPGARQ